MFIIQPYSERLSDLDHQLRKNQKKKKEKRTAYLPALVRSAVIGVVFGDVGVDATESQLLVRSGGDGLDDQLCIGVRWLGLVLDRHLHQHSKITHGGTEGFFGTTEVAQSSPWGCLHQPTPPAVRLPRPFALQCSASARKRPWRHTRLLAGGQRSRCARTDTPMSPPLVDWPDRSWEHCERREKSLND